MSIRDIRHRLGLTQIEMAAELGVRQSSISRIESGRAPVNKRTQLAAEALLLRSGRVSADEEQPA